MAKSQTSYGTNASNNLINQAQGMPLQLIGGLQQAGATQSTNQTAQENAAQSGIEQAQTTGGYNPTQLANLENETQNFANTGGFTNAQTNTLNAGGYDPTTLNNIMGGYSSFANTGGYTPQQANQFMQQATEGTTDTYNTLEQQAQEAAVASGGQGTGGAVSQMARQLGQAQASNTLNAEVALNQQENANKLSGLSGEAGVESNVAGNTLTGTGMLQQGELAGLTQQQNLQSNVASGTNTANSQMSQLYNTTTGQITALGQQVLSAMGLDFGTQSQAISALTNLSKNPGALQTTLSDLSGLGGAAAGVLA